MANLGDIAANTAIQTAAESAAAYQPLDAQLTSLAALAYATNSGGCMRLPVVGPVPPHVVVIEP